MRKEIVEFANENLLAKDIKKKFNEKSDILDMIDWNAKNTLLFYTMLKKDFEFINEFDKFL